MNTNEGKKFVSIRVYSWFYSPMSQMVFRTQLRVPYSQCTVGNHVYYSRYLDILEAARGEFFRHLGTTYLELQKADTIFPVVEVRLSYKAPARYDDLLTIELWVTEMTGVRLNVGSRILADDGKLLVEGETKHVCTGADEKPKRLPKELVARLQPYAAARENGSPG